MKKPQLVKDWRQSWRWYSQQAAGLQVALAASWLAIPEDARASIPTVAVALAFGIPAVLGVVGRLIDQDAPK
jgi:hypothetical protein